MVGFFDIPINNIQIQPLLVQWVREKIPDYQQCVIVAKNAGASKRAAVFAKKLKIEFAMVLGGDKEDDGAGQDDAEDEVPHESPLRPTKDGETSTETPYRHGGVIGNVSNR